jgi:general secretion pathway protein J
MKTRPAANAGFTLVEVLVALLAMALLAAMAWQALDGVLRARDSSRDSMDRTVRLSTVLTQWEQDLRAVHDSGLVPAISFDGQTLRLTRRVEGGVALVAWSVRGGLWQRWASPAVTRSGPLQEAWLRSQQLLGNEPGQLTLAEEASEWQVYFSRGGQWTNAQSTGDIAQPVAPPPATPGSAPAAAPREQLPDAVRLVITLGGAKLTRDIALEPS